MKISFLFLLYGIGIDKHFDYLMLWGKVINIKDFSCLSCIYSFNSKILFNSVESTPNLKINRVSYGLFK